MSTGNSNSFACGKTRICNNFEIKVCILGEKEEKAVDNSVDNVNNFCFHKSFSEIM